MEDEIIGRDSDGALNEEYCKWCYADGTYTYGDMDELIEVCVKHMANENCSEEQARFYMKELLPSGMAVKFLNDQTTYLGTQRESEFGGERCI